MPDTDSLDIRLDDLRGPQIAALLKRHLDHLYSVTPAGSVYALDLDRLRLPEVTFWSGWLGSEVVACAALKDLGGGHGEIKSMHTAAEHRGKGIAARMVAHVIGEATARGMSRLSLETGQGGHFGAAQHLYRSLGFVETGPFGDYGPDPHSYFMTRALQRSAGCD